MKKKDVWKNGAELHYEWGDGCTISVEHFDSYEEAEKYAEEHYDCDRVNIYPRI